MFNFFKKKTSAPTPGFKFSDSPNTACFVCDHVLNKERPILYASHDADDGGWQFLCGQDDHTEANAKIISLQQATAIDETINDLYEMPLGVGAHRETVNAKWVAFRHE